MLLASILIAAVQVGSSAGLDAAEAQRIASHVQAVVAADPAAAQLDLHLEIIGGLSRHLLLIEHRDGETILGRAECALRTDRVTSGDACISSAVTRFAREIRASAATPAAPLVVDVEPGVSPSTVVSLSAATVAVAATVVGIVFAVQSRGARAERDALLNVGPELDELDRRQARLATGAGVALSISFAATVAAITVAMAARGPS